MTDTLATASAPATAPTAASAVPAADVAAIESARATIKMRIEDKEFRTKLLAQDPAARAEWDNLHKSGYPAPPQITSTEDVKSQAETRNAESWNSYVSWLKQSWAMTPENEAEIRGGVVRADIHEWAQEERDRLVKDRAFYRRLLDGDREAKTQWGKVVAILSLRPVK